MWGLLLAPQVAHRHNPLLSLRTTSGAYLLLLRQNVLQDPLSTHASRLAGSRNVRELMPFGVHFGETQEAADTFFSLLPHHGQLGDAVISYSLADDIPGDQSPVLVMKLWPAQ